MKENVPRLVLVNSLAHEMGHLFGLSDEYCSNLAGSTDCRCNDGGSLEWMERCEWKVDLNPLSSSFGCDPNRGGNCCGVRGLPICDPFINAQGRSDGGYHVCCLGNTYLGDGRSLMSYANSPAPRGFDSPSLGVLNIKSKLKCN